MKRLIDIIVLLIVLSLPLVALPGCSKGDNKPPEKSTEEKLDSENADERMEGVNEADKKYGGGP